MADYTPQSNYTTSWLSRTCHYGAPSSPVPPYLPKPLPNQTGPLNIPHSSVHKESNFGILSLPTPFCGALRRSSPVLANTIHPSTHVDVPSYTTSSLMTKKELRKCLAHSSCPCLVWTTQPVLSTQQTFPHQLLLARLPKMHPPKRNYHQPHRETRRKKTHI